MEISLKDKLYELFVGLPAYDASISGNSNYRMRVKDIYSNNVTIPNVIPQVGGFSTTIASVVMLQTYQELWSIAMCDPVASIVFGPNLLPIAPTQASVARQLGSNNLVNGGNNSNLLIILSDFSMHLIWIIDVGHA